MIIQIYISMEHMNKTLRSKMYENKKNLYENENEQLIDIKLNTNYCF